MYDLLGKSVFITGGSSGIGFNMAELFVQLGAHVAVFDRQPSPETLGRILAGRVVAGQDVLGYHLDVTDAAATDSALGRAAEDIGAPYIVFHAAGIGGFSRRFEEFSPDRFEEIIRVNLLGTRNVAAAALPLMRPGGKLALVASLAGLVAAYGQSGYAASKHGVIGLAGVLRIEWKPKGIDVCVICPPEIDTPMAQEDRRTRPPETTAMKMVAGVVDLDEACHYMVERIQRGQFLIIPGRRARVTWLLQKILPRALTNALADRMVAKVQARGASR